MDIPTIGDALVTKPIVQSCICNRLFPEQRSLERHLESPCGTDPDEIQCETCMYVFSKRMLTVHQRENPPCRNGTGKECSRCKKWFPTETDLDCHRTGGSCRVIICDICQETLKSKGALREHLKKRMSCRVIICDICQETLKSKGALREHRKKNVACRPSFLCVRCGKSFKTQTGHQDCTGLPKSVSEGLGDGLSKEGNAVEGGDKDQQRKEIRKLWT